MKDDLKTYIADLEAATASRSRLEGELAAAREIQMSMLPRGGEAFEQQQQISAVGACATGQVRGRRPLQLLTWRRAPVYRRW